MAGLKRTVTLEGAPSAKRVKRLEKKVAALKPEMKHKHFTLDGTVNAGNFALLDVTALSADDDVDDRTGQRVKLWRVEVRGVSESNVDFMLVQMHGNTLPVIGDFTGEQGSMIIDQKLNSVFTEWKYFPPSTAYTGETNRVRCTQSFKNGMVVKYNGFSSPAVQNRLLVIAVNHSAANKTVDFTARVWYTDA